MTESRIEHVTCLGCGCGCDDLTVSVRDGRISQVDPACPVGRAWFGDGSIPGEALRSGRAVPLDEAIAEAADLLMGSSGRCLIYVGSDLTTQAQRQAVALADLLGATVDTSTSDTAAAGILAAQRRGRAGATLGEIRNRADALLFWGVDPAQRYPRFMDRFVEPAGTHLPGGRSDRTLIGISVGLDLAPKNADLTVELRPDEEIPAISYLRAALQGRPTALSSARAAQLTAVLDRLTKARYVGLIHDAEPTAQPRNPLRVEGLIALAQALNRPTRAALIGLRAGGNRVGAESVLTWQTGYPLAVGYSRGSPRYAPERRGLDELHYGAFRAVLIIGSAEIDGTESFRFSGVSSILVGPRASRSALSPNIAIDTGVAGIHEGGTGYRLDDLPLRLRPVLDPPRATTAVLQALLQAVSGRAVERRP
jgi:formylmethanofuran dehydrogenase subunit B